MAERTDGKRSWGGRVLFLCLLGAVLAVAVWWLRRPKIVVVTHPKPVSLTETIASSARVHGIQETAVGAQFTGTVERLFVRDGDHVRAGQQIAILRNEVTQQQKAQARTAVETARARLVQVSRPPTKSELDEAQHQVSEARAQARQAAADLDLATKQFARSDQLFHQGLIARSEFDTAESNLESLRARERSTRATVRVREAKLETLKDTPRTEDVEVARAQLSEAEQALQVAEQQTKEAAVKAPFSGIVTKIGAEEGQTVGSAGVVNLVSDELEVRVDLDENNLADLEVGQRAVLSASAFNGQTFNGHLKEIGASVDQSRGIVVVKIAPEDPPSWLRPGQTVNVNLITNTNVERLIVPATAVLRQGGRTVVYVVEKGRADEHVVLTRPTVHQGVPVAAGLNVEDAVIVNPSGITSGQPVRVRTRP